LRDAEGAVSESAKSDGPSQKSRDKSRMRTGPRRPRADRELLAFAESRELDEQAERLKAGKKVQQ